MLERLSLLLLSLEILFGQRSGQITRLQMISKYQRGYECKCTVAIFCTPEHLPTMVSGGDVENREAPFDIEQVLPHLRLAYFPPSCTPSCKANTSKESNGGCLRYYLCLYHFFSIFIYGVKFSLINGHQAVGKIEICSYMITDR